MSLHLWRAEGTPSLSNVPYCVMMIALIKRRKQERGKHFNIKEKGRVWGRRGGWGKMTVGGGKMFQRFTWKTEKRLLSSKELLAGSWPGSSGDLLGGLSPPGFYSQPCHVPAMRNESASVSPGGDENGWAHVGAIITQTGTLAVCVNGSVGSSAFCLWDVTTLTQFSVGRQIERL